MIKYVDDKCCHVSRLHLVMGNIWNKVIHPRLLQHLGDGIMNNVVGKNTLLVGWGVLFGEIIDKIFLVSFQVYEEHFYVTQSRAQ